MTQQKSVRQFPVGKRMVGWKTFRCIILKWKCVRMAFVPLFAIILCISEHLKEQTLNGWKQLIPKKTIVCVCARVLGAIWKCSIFFVRHKTILTCAVHFYIFTKKFCSNGARDGMRIERSRSVYVTVANSN